MTSKQTKSSSDVIIGACHPGHTSVTLLIDRQRKVAISLFLFFLTKIQLELTFSLLLVSGARRSG